MENIKKKYIALTLGPITRVIGLAESTKELWAASYFFSYLAKNIISPFKGRTFLLPLVDKQIFQISNGAGLFPDRYIFEAQEGDFEKLNENVNIVLDSISEKMSLSLNITKEKIGEFLKVYLKVFFMEKSFNPSMDRKQVVADCEHSLNLLEMQETFPDKEKINYLYSFFKQVNGTPIWEGKTDKIITGFNGTFLTLDAYGENSKGKKLFESIIEISASELKIDLIDRYNNTAKERKKEVKDKYLLDAEKLILEDERIRPYHKYIAIVKSDGDSMGKTIERINDTSKLSKALLDFNNDSVKIITEEYGGKPVFIGGDDLLFFAPVYYNGKTIFDLIQSLDDSFAKSLAQQIEQDIPLPTLSYGISITYYKYPMFEALNTADYLLERIAKGRELQEQLIRKGIKTVEIEKNNVAFVLQKHSGQMNTALFHKWHQESFKMLLELIGKYCSKAEQSQEGEKFLVSVMHKLREQSFMLSFILKCDPEGALLKNFFDNTFNEKVHKNYVGLFDDLQKFIKGAYKEFQKSFTEYNQKVNDEKLRIDLASRILEQVNTILQFVHFINSKNDE